MKASVIISDKRGHHVRFVPSVEIEQEKAAVELLQQQVQRLCGLPVAIGRELCRHEAADGEVFSLYEAFAAEHAGQWHKRGDLQIMPNCEAHRPALQAWLAEKKPPELRAPWFQAGWHEKAWAWGEQAVLHAGRQLTGELVQLKASDFSFVQRMGTNAGDVYLKATGTAARHEAALTRHLAGLHANTAAVLDTQETEGWLLMPGLGGTPLRGQTDHALWQGALRAYAQLQVAEAAQVEKLLTMGVPDRRIPVLKRDIREHLADMCATGLAEEEAKQVLDLQEELLDMCDQLIAIGLPDSIEHGDLHSANIRIVDGQPFFFDWGDASITHPFFSTRIFWHALDELIASEAEWLDMVNRFRPYYLEAWKEFAEEDKLKQALLITDQLACVQRALSWHLYLTPSREDQAESYRRPSQWLQLLLEHRALVRQS
ncbi:aminoglycoside phosphotransferase family protein [Ectobacillus ponti]|uniref:Aminoglycoside phosphotransferase family protein n=1 Tax=Ectobacillus ponti TaxID=2961894 RepID=A0AA41X869_9BACI|nr:aminoglycoside phosphotransferase family protein [Ectobacillus ponti]MCP8968943.1 aminoglycoside phosphotransferase family protein [Ectobacillus ponti]